MKRLTINIPDQDLWLLEELERRVQAAEASGQRSSVSREARRTLARGFREGCFTHYNPEEGPGHGNDPDN